MCEHGCRASHNEGDDGPNIRPKQLRNREVRWEGSYRSKLMSRRTERPYKVDGTGKLAPHSAARCSVPEINGPVVQQEFTSLLRETCHPSPPATAGAALSNGCRAGAGVSRGRSTESNEPENEETGRTHNSGRAELGRQTRPSLVLSRSDEADRLSYRAAINVAEKECCVIPQGLSGTAVRGPACTVVWEPGGATLPATRLGHLLRTHNRHVASSPASPNNVVVEGSGTC
jgi:hypothetical protein